MAATCTATKRNGEPCTLPANGPHGLCWAHDPANAERRRRGASRGGRAKANSELTNLKREIREVIGNVLGGGTKTGAAAVAFQGYNTLLKTVELERRVRETDELAAELEELKREHGVA